MKNTARKDDRSDAINTPDNSSVAGDTPDVSELAVSMHDGRVK